MPLHINFWKAKYYVPKFFLNVKWMYLERVLFEILCKIIIISFFIMWYMWDKKMVRKIKKMIQKRVCDASTNIVFNNHMSTHSKFIIYISTSICLNKNNVAIHLCFSFIVTPLLCMNLEKCGSSDFLVKCVNRNFLMPTLQI